MTAQDMLYVYRLLESIGLQVELLMMLEMDNKGAVDLANNWSVGGRTSDVDVRNHFLRDLKDEGLLIMRYVPGDENDAEVSWQSDSDIIVTSLVRSPKRRPFQAPPFYASYLVRHVFDFLSYCT